MQGQRSGEGRDGRPDAGTGAFGPNAWLVEDMYERYQADPSSVSPSWQEFFADYRPARPVSAPPATGTAVAGTAAPAGRTPVAPVAATDARCDARRAAGIGTASRVPRRSGVQRAGSWPTWRRRSGCRRPPACGWCRPSCSRSTGPSSTTI